MTLQSESPIEKDLAYQDVALQEVSRTFAFTIPQLPEALRHVVSNAYLLCRINDTIEDEPALSVAQKSTFWDQFVAVVGGKESPENFSRELGSLLSEQTLPAEHDLIANTDRVIRVTHSLTGEQRNSLERCVRVMAKGMLEFQREATPEGLDDIEHMDKYCYYVAGVVGEMLEELFCDYCEEIKLKGKHEEMMRLSVSFGKGLQLTNILKDIWEDKERGTCWLARDVFQAEGCTVGRVSAGEGGPAFEKGLNRLLAEARHHLTHGIRYSLLVPPHETGIRLHCLWTVGMAILTMRRIHANPNFRSAQEVKISRLSVKSVIFVSRLFARSDFALGLLFRLALAGLPYVAKDSYGYVPAQEN